MSWIDAARAKTVYDVTDALGYQLRRGRFGPCPACGRDEPRHPPVTLRHSGRGWMCAGCKATGDALTLVAWRVSGAAKPSDWSSVRAWFDSGAGAAPVVRRVEAPKHYPPAEEVSALLRACSPVDQSPEVLAWWQTRTFGDVHPAGVLPKVYAWPRWWPASFRAWSCVVSMVDTRGRVRSLHGRAPSSTLTPKTRFPLGCRADGLLFACALARGMLRGHECHVSRVVVVEGVTDFLALASRPDPGVAVLGACSGGFSALAGAAIADVPVIVATDHDDAGHRYAAEVLRAMPNHDIRRWNP